MFDMRLWTLLTLVLIAAVDFKSRDAWALKAHYYRMSRAAGSMEFAHRLTARGKHAESIHWYKEAVRYAPHNVGYRNDLGYALLTVGDSWGAVQEYCVARDHYGPGWPTERIRGVLLVQLARLDDPWIHCAGE